MRTGRVGRSNTRAGGALAQLLLVVVLALGVFVMHAVGHPESPSDAAADGMTHVSAAPHQTDDEAPASSSHDPGMDMDMTTLCVAVLGIWALARFVLAALRRRPDRLVGLLSRLTHALGPNAPPRIPPDLAQLSVLRI
ncbi:DUF6153 family protein [Streptomyces sp. NBC_01353]|uniref:DUF6153 family protein n=1 Tax=Streptomyces sp. NBC_01353 TaxID=2903835 RepID=UPI002E365E66|nr:DUF6153 family protein [Streptomyces sp. NBC_01353]